MTWHTSAARGRLGPAVTLMLATAEQPPSLGVWAGYSHNVRRSFPAPVGFELATNCIHFYAIANLDKTSHILLLLFLCCITVVIVTATGTVTAARVRVRLDDTKLYQSRWTRPSLPASGRTSPSNGLVTAAAWEAQFFLPVPGWVASAAGT